MSTSTVPPASADAFSLLSLYHTPALALETFTTKLQNKPLALHPTLPVTDARSQRRDIRATKKASRANRKPAPLTAKEKRQTKAHDLPKKLSYETFLPLHELWKTYAMNLQGGMASWAAMDLHGALVEVVRSRAVGRVGLKGIVVKETRAVLVLVTEKGEGKTVPKEFTVFGVTIPGKQQGEEKKLELLGNQMMFRAAERAGRKFKSKAMLDL
ncbi:Rof/RNase P-like protein [Pyronema omphalodes]|nr:Rof/RNase P-like protein [Pyronema omphalodes]